MLGARDIPVVQTQRGGQVTYHGPGQVVAYPLVDLPRLHIYVKEYVFRLEEALLRTLASYGVTGHRVRQDPFLGLGKIAALGIKVSRHCAYHGLALNVAMDLEPFARINPCGYAGLPTVDLQSLGVLSTWPAAAERLSTELQRLLRPA